MLLSEAGKLQNSFIKLRIKHSNHGFVIKLLERVYKGPTIRRERERGRKRRLFSAQNQTTNNPSKQGKKPFGLFGFLSVQDWKESKIEN